MPIRVVSVSEEEAKPRLVKLICKIYSGNRDRKSHPLEPWGSDYPEVGHGPD